MSLRFASLFPILILLGCAAGQRQVANCSIFEVLGGKSIPLGLVTVPAELEARLRAQLSEEMARGQLCWYIENDELIAAEPKNPKSFVYGEVFVKDRDGEWQRTDEAARVLAVPELVR